MISTSLNSSENHKLGDFLAACVYNQDKIPDRFKEQSDYYHLKYTTHDGQVVVASTGWDQAGWSQIPNGSLLAVGGDKKVVISKL